jgi:hypothetical protein
MGILRLVGEKTEQVDIVKKLLDVNYFKERPGYQLAEADNLVLFDCKYKDVQFYIPEGANRVFLERIIFNLYHQQILNLKLITCISQNYMDSIMEGDQHKIVRRFKKKNKKKRTIEEAYKNHIYGKNNIMIKPDQMREMLAKKKKRIQKKRKEYQEKIKKK